MNVVADTSLYTTTKERLLAVAECIKAEQQGQVVQFKHKMSDEWKSNITKIHWSYNNLGDGDYRVETRPLEVWVNVWNADNIPGSSAFRTQQYAKLVAGQKATPTLFRQVVE